MGLLDDAIREHLELKRQRGADPSEVDREERTVLAPLRPDESLEPNGYPPVGRDGSISPGEDQRVDDEGLSDDEGLPAADPDAIQETVEIDMRTVLESGDSGEGFSWAEPVGEALAESATPASAGIDHHSASTTDAEEDSPNPEVPAKRARRFRLRSGGS